MSCRPARIMSWVARMISHRLLPIVLCACLSGGPALLADGIVTGRGRFEKVKGKPQLGYAELYESNLFLSPDGGFTRGPSFRLGAPPGQAPTHDGFFRFEVPAGTWSAVGIRRHRRTKCPTIRVWNAGV